jgi:hypothetical protein
MAIFNLKYRDTRPVLEVTLYDPAPEGSAPATLGPVHDLTGSSAWYLHVYLSDGTVVTRPLTKVGADAAGTLRYVWVAADWDVANPAGHLIVSPALPLLRGTREHRMEYEVLGPGDERLTFPNGGASTSEVYDVLRIWQDIGQG